MFCQVIAKFKIIITIIIIIIIIIIKVIIINKRKRTGIILNLKTKTFKQILNAKTNFKLSW